ncbi:Prolamin-like domain [Macleaya cordata]|uniref:Prolamin-like domain n=1 Tax=Macleaya cordata TaxID=56857 RepID=A0A200QC79_MACCD|nr:Prolamin-like domain [Macleaya cordata]
MALINSKLVLLLTLSAFMASTATTVVLGARELAINKLGKNLATRLNAEGGGGIGECWNALLQLRSCTNEIILFFLDGETYLGLECCKAIRIITRDCWPSMLTSLGFTAEEGDILRGYCDASSSAPPSAPVTTIPPVQSLAQSPFLGPSPSLVVG